MNLLTWVNVFLLGGIAASVPSMARADTPCDKSISAALNESKTDLTLNIQDKKDVRNACDYLVRRIEYVAPANALLVELQKQPCFVDRYGKQKAAIQWPVPMTLKSGGKIQLILNHKKAGNITFKAGEAAFDLETESKCEGDNT